jgi:peptidylprolyl isomerase
VSGVARPLFAAAALVCAALGLGACANRPAATLEVATKATTAELLAASAPAEWRGLDLANTLDMRLSGDRVVLIELAPAMAPLASANIKTLVRAGYFDGLSVNRVQDNFVAQWGDPAGETEPKRPLGAAAATVAPEFERSIAGGPAFIPLPGHDGYAAETGFVGAFPAARNPSEGRMWLAHCYGMVGVGRDNAPESGSGAELYAVIGHSPRQLDRNITLAGRVVWGIEHLSGLQRGTGALGFYEQASQRTPILSVRIAADLPAGGVAGTLEALSTDSATFKGVIEARRNRRDAWYLRPAGHIDLCSVLLPVRKKPS